MCWYGSLQKLIYPYKSICSRNDRYANLDFSDIKPWLPNDDAKYPSRTIDNPGPVDVNGVEEFLVDSIIDHRKIGRGYQYLVHFKGFGPEDDRWIAGREMENNEALDIYLKNNPLLFPSPNAPWI